MVRLPEHCQRMIIDFKTYFKFRFKSKIRVDLKMLIVISRALV